MDMVLFAILKKFVKDTVAGMGAIKGDKGDKGKDGIDGVSPSVTVNTNTDTDYTLDISDSTHSFTTPNLKGAKGDTGAQGIRGEKGEQGSQGIQGETGAKGDKGDKGDDGYPFLIYKQYDSIEEFSADDFPEIGLMFMVMVWETGEGYPIYRYTGDGNYSLVTYMNSEGIKGEKGDKGDKGDTGDKGTDGLNGIDGTTYTPVVKSVQTLDSDSSAIVSVEVNEENKTAEFSFGIPKGKDGSDGVDGQDGKDAEIVNEVKSGETKAVSSGAVYDAVKKVTSYSPVFTADSEKNPDVTAEGFTVRKIGNTVSLIVTFRRVLFNSGGSSMAIGKVSGIPLPLVQTGGMASIWYTDGGEVDRTAYVNLTSSGDIIGIEGANIPSGQAVSVRFGCTYITSD